MLTQVSNVRSLQQVAALQDRDIARVAARSTLFASRLWRLASSAGKQLHAELDARQAAALEDELVDVMCYAYLLRRRLDKRRRSVGKSANVELSYVHEQARRLAGQIDIDLGRLQDKFRVLARRRLRGTLKDIRHTLQQAIKQARYRSLTARQSVAHVLTRLRKHGIEPRSTGYVETLVRTHAAIAYGAAHRASYFGDPDVWGFELVTMRDDRVRDSHEETDGIRRKKNDEFWLEWWPPNGWGCRCQAVAIYDWSTRQTPVPHDLEPDPDFKTDWLYLLEN